MKTGMKLAWVLLLLPVAAAAEEQVVIDWSSAKLVSAPTNLNRNSVVTLRVTNVNDFIYTYEGDIEVKPAEAASGQRVATLEGNNCADWNAARSLFQPFIPQKKGDKYGSIPLRASLKSWIDFQPAYQKIESKIEGYSSCTEFSELVGKMRKAKTASEGTHEYNLPRSELLGPGDSVTVWVKESYDGVPTDGGDGSGEARFSFRAGSPVFFFSVGYLATQLENRSYDVVDVGTERPANSDAATVLKELKIQGNGGFTPAAATLLHYRLPFHGLPFTKKSVASNAFGFALSAGPVFRLTSSGSGSATSNVGFFAGASLHLWERFWITPGWHLGEFSDLPRGFTAAGGLRVPEGIANPITGVTRPTWRFGVAFSFRAADFQRTQATTEQPATGGSKATPAAPGPAPAKSDAGAAAGGTNLEAAQKAVDEADKQRDAARLARNKAANELQEATRKKMAAEDALASASADQSKDALAEWKKAVAAQTAAEADLKNKTEELEKAEKDLAAASKALQAAQP
jgi:hypothetical protein